MWFALILLAAAVHGQNFTELAWKNIDTIQELWFNNDSFTWQNTGWWNSANLIEAYGNSMLLSNMDPFGSLYADLLSTQPASYILADGSNDDVLWWSLAWAKAFEVTGLEVYLNQSILCFVHVSQSWDNTTCGGGVWWSSARNYKNAVTNELFLMAATVLHRLTPAGNSVDFLRWAQLEWAWFESSGMINSQWLINDGLTSECTNNNQTEWTYNQGVILGGLLNMYELTGNKTLLTIANNLANASTSLLIYPNGILKESCEPNNCDGDQIQFKGIYIRYLGYLTASGVLDVTHANAFRYFIQNNAQSNVNNNQYIDPQGHTIYGLVWEGPYSTAQFQAPCQSSVLDSFNAAISIGL